MAVIGSLLLGFGLPFVIGVALVQLLSRFLQRHRLSEKEFRRLELEDRNGVPAMMLPTLTTEATQQAGRDPKFEIEVQQVRQRGMGW